MLALAAHGEYWTIKGQLKRKVFSAFSAPPR